MPLPASTLDRLASALRPTAYSAACLGLVGIGTSSA